MSSIFARKCPDIPIPPLDGRLPKPMFNQFHQDIWPNWTEQVYAANEFIGAPTFANYALSSEAKASIRAPIAPVRPIPPTAAELEADPPKKSTFHLLLNEWTYQNDKYFMELDVDTFLKTKWHNIFTTNGYGHLTLPPNSTVSTTKTHTMINTARLFFITVPSEVHGTLDEQIYKPYDGSPIASFIYALDRALRFHRQLNYGHPTLKFEDPLNDPFSVSVLLKAFAHSKYSAAFQFVIRQFKSDFPEIIHYPPTPTLGTRSEPIVVTTASEKRTFATLAARLTRERDGIADSDFHAMCAAANLATITVTGHTAEIQHVARNLPTTSAKHDLYKRAPSPASTHKQGSPPSRPSRHQHAPPRAPSPHPARGASPSRSASPTPRNTAPQVDKQCAIHGTCGHDTSECREIAHIKESRQNRRPWHGRGSKSRGSN